MYTMSSIRIYILPLLIIFAVSSCNDREKDGQASDAAAAKKELLLQNREKAVSIRSNLISAKLDGDSLKVIALITELKIIDQSNEEEKETLARLLKAHEYFIEGVNVIDAKLNAEDAETKDDASSLSSKIKDSESFINMVSPIAETQADYLSKVINAKDNIEKLATGYDINKRFNGLAESVVSKNVLSIKNLCLIHQMLVTQSIESRIQLISSTHSLTLAIIDLGYSTKGYTKNFWENYQNGRKDIATSLESKDLKSSGLLKEMVPNQDFLNTMGKLDNYYTQDVTRAISDWATTLDDQLSDIDFPSGVPWGQFSRMVRLAGEKINDSWSEVNKKSTLLKKASNDEIREELDGLKKTFLADEDSKALEKDEDVELSHASKANDDGEKKNE